MGLGSRYPSTPDAWLSRNAPRQIGRCVPALSANQALHRYDVRHGEARLPGDLHDAARGPDVLQVAFGEDGALLPPADGGRVGICLPGRDDDGVFVWGRPGGDRRLRVV